MVVLHRALVLWATSLCVCSFTPIIGNVRTDNLKLFSAIKKEEERLLRQELADKNSIVEDEGKYGLADGEGMAALLETSEEDEAKENMQSAPASSRERTQSLESQIDRMVKPRPYPLFLAEKAAELLETSIDSLSKASSSVGLEIGDSQTKPNGVKEKVLILGTGWGAASFLKEIDPDLYDVTVISPRNYFLFTPMLAGASVGTVEFRSITEPIREVSWRVMVSSYVQEL